MFVTLDEKVFNGMKMSLITGAKLRAVQVQGDRDALVLHLHFISLRLIHILIASFPD